jgi:hypothetical protein
MRKQADALKVCPIPDACLLVMAQRPYRLLGSPETRSSIFLIKNSPDQVEGYLDYLQPVTNMSSATKEYIWQTAASLVPQPVNAHVDALGSALLDRVCGQHNCEFIVAEQCDGWHDVPHGGGHIGELHATLLVHEGCAILYFPCRGYDHIDDCAHAVNHAILSGGIISITEVWDEI